MPALPSPPRPDPTAACAPPRAAWRWGASARALWAGTTAVLTGVAGAACAARPAVGLPGGGPAAPGRAARSGPAAPTADLTAVYRRMGLTVAGGDVPFVARLAYLAGATPDSTLALVTLSLAARALTFAREGAGYRADYDVRLEVRRAPAAGGASAMVPVLREAVGEAAVRVATFRETSRGDESVVHAQTVALPPGRYALAVTVRDAGSGRATTADVLVRVPRLGPGVPGGGLSTPLAVYEARPRVRTGEALRVLVNARATAAVGRDTTALVYVEAYGGPASAPDSAPAGVAAAVLLRDDRGAPVWRDSLVLARVPAAPAAGRAPDPAPAPYAGVARVPVSRLGFGVLTFQIVRRDAPADTAAARLLVTLGNELPATSFDEAIGYLRYYAAPDRLRAVREAGPRERPARWAAFLASTDPDPRTPAHEGLADYVARLRAASARFAEAGAAGWATDRGRAYLVLGEPDQITDANVPEQGQRGRTQVWEYREPRVQLVFTDQHGRGRWRIAPTGAAALDAVLAGRFARRAGP